MADIKLKDGSGNPTIYQGVSEIKLPTSDGGMLTFGNTGWAEEELKISGYNRFQPESTEVRISHGLGVVPDFIFVGKLDTKDNTDQKNYCIQWAFGWSRRMETLLDKASISYGYGVRNSIAISKPDDTTDSYTPQRFLSNNSIDEDDTTYNMLIRKANNTSFVIGKTPDGTTGSTIGTLNTNSEYFWFAVAGLGARMNKVSEV